MSAPLRVLLSDNGFLSVSAQFYEMGVSTRRPSTENLRGSELQTDWTFKRFFTPLQHLVQLLLLSNKPKRTQTGGGGPGPRRDATPHPGPGAP